MKMFVVVYDDYLDERTTNAFKQAGYKAYTKVHGVTGEGEKHPPKLGNRKGPGKNNTLSLAVSDADIPRLIKVIENLKAQYPIGGWRAFTFPLERCI